MQIRAKRFLNKLDCKSADPDRQSLSVNHDIGTFRLLGCLAFTQTLIYPHDQLHDQLAEPSGVSTSKLDLHVCNAFLCVFC
jgi:hypothetical protein